MSLAPSSRVCLVLPPVQITLPSEFLKTCRGSESPRPGFSVVGPEKRTETMMMMVFVMWWWWFGRGEKYMVELCSEADRDAVETKLENFGVAVHRHVRSLKRLPALYVRSERAERFEKVLVSDGICGVHRVRSTRAKHVVEKKKTTLEREMMPMGKYWHLDRVNQNYLPLDGDDSTLATGRGQCRNQISILRDLISLFGSSFIFYFLTVVSCVQS